MGPDRVKLLPAVPAEHNRVQQCLAPGVGLVLLCLQREIAFLRGLERGLYFTTCGDKLMQAKSKKAPIRSNFHLIGSQKEIPQRCQDLVLIQPCLLGQCAGGLLQGVRLTAHPFAMSQPVFFLEAELQLDPAGKRVLT